MSYLLCVIAASILCLAMHLPFAANAQTERPTLVSEHVIGDPIPRELLDAYAHVVEAARSGDIGDILSLALPSSLAWSKEVRDPARREYGTEINLAFLKDGFRAEIALVRKERDDCYLMRTGSTALWFVKASDSKWWLYRYSDKPIE